MNVEYFGLPGAGKSYLCRQLADHLALTAVDNIVVAPMIDDRNPVSFNLSKISRALLFMLSNYRTCLRVLSVIFSSKAVSTRNQISKTIYLLSECHRVHARQRGNTNESRIVIVEQGVLQTIWSLEMLSEESLADSLMSGLSEWLPDIAIFVEPTNRNTYFQQVKGRKRGQSYVDRLNQADLEDEFTPGNEALQRVTGLLTFHRPVAKVIHLVNDHGLDPARTIELLHGR